MKFQNGKADFKEVFRYKHSQTACSKRQAKCKRIYMPGTGQYDYRRVN